MIARQKQINKNLFSPLFASVIALSGFLLFVLKHRSGQPIRGLIQLTNTDGVNQTRPAAGFSYILKHDMPSNS